VRHRNLIEVWLWCLAIWFFFGVLVAWRQSCTLNKQKALTSLGYASVEIENNQAAVVKTHEGYFLVIPIKLDRRNGSYKILFSQSGHFADAELIAEDTGDISDMGLVVKGHHIHFCGGSRTSVYVCLPPSDHTSSIAKCPSSDPNAIDVSKLEFENHPACGANAVEQFTEKQLQQVTPAK